TAESVVYIEAFKLLVNEQIESGCHGISVTSTIWAPSSLTIAARKRIMDLATAAIDSRVIFTPGTGSTNHDETMVSTKYAEEIGADAAMVIVPRSEERRVGKEGSARGRDYPRKTSIKNR